MNFSFLVPSYARTEKKETIEKKKRVAVKRNKEKAMKKRNFFLTMENKVMCTQTHTA